MPAVHDSAMTPPTARASKKNRRDRKKSISKPGAYFPDLKQIDRAVQTAMYYGFSPLPAPLTVSRDDRERARAMSEEGTAGGGPADMPSLVLEEQAALFRYCREKKITENPQPALIASEFAAAARKSEVKNLHLDILGSPKGIAEAIVIAAARAILSEEGFPELMVHINSVGDRESSNRFLRELSNYYRRNVGGLSASCRFAWKKDPTELLSCPHEKCRLLAAEAPKSISFLSEESRARLKEVLEHLEEIGIPYCMNHQLVGNRALATETVFAVRECREEDTGSWLAAGARYNNLWKRFGAGRETAGIGAVVRLRRPLGRKKKGGRMPLKHPGVFFLQLGCDAKLKSLKVVELLRQAGIFVHQALAREKLSTQLSAAEHLRTPYSIIMGQKEALENSVIVRENATRAQETVSLADLPAYLVKLS